MSKEKSKQKIKVSRQPKEVVNEDTSVGSALFKRRAIQFAQILGFEQTVYDELPQDARQAIEFLGYDNFLIVLMKFDMMNGRSLNQIARKYGVHRMRVFRRCRK